MTYVICYSFFGDKMKIFKNINFLIIIILIMVILLSMFYLKNNVMISESSKVSYIDDNDIIGYIRIDKNNINKYLLQGLDNQYYLNHNYLKNYDENGEIFLDYEGDLLNDKNSIIYSKVNNFNDINSLINDDIIEIIYINNKLCYKVNNNKNNSNLVIKIIGKNKVKKIYAKKIKC